MLTLSLFVALIVWVCVRVKKKKQIIPIDFITESLNRRPSKDDDPPWLLLLLISIVSIIFVSYAGMLTFIRNYDTNAAAITEHKTSIAKLTNQSQELNEIINEKIKKLSNSTLPKEDSFKEILLLNKKKRAIQQHIWLDEQSLKELPTHNSPERLKAYKFLLYFG